MQTAGRPGNKNNKLTQIMYKSIDIFKEKYVFNIKVKM